eukprot:scaffold657367_cov64-Prasinocladus_malaysianus.AAC.1
MTLLITQDYEDLDPMRAASESPDSMSSDTKTNDRNKQPPLLYGDGRKPMYTVSPYTRLRLAPAHACAPRSGQELLETEKLEVMRLREALEQRGHPVSLTTLRQGLMPPPQKTWNE